MNVNELHRLAQWFGDQFPELDRLYGALIQPVQHNANNSNKIPVEPQLEALVSFLRAMSFSALSLEQLAVLDEQAVQPYIGREGAAFVESAIRTSDFDPATAVQKLQAAHSAVQNANRTLQAYADALQNLGVDLGQFEPADDTITIRIGFRREAAIENVTDLKNSSQDWYDIIRGLSLAVGEPPEATRIIGAGTGSIILFLAATAGVTFLLARISKHVTGIAHDIISVESAREDLRQKKLLSRAIEKDLNEQIKLKKTTALETIMAEVKEAIPDINGEARNAVENAVNKLLAFSRKGGDVDFVEPAEDDAVEPDANDPSPIGEARAAIREYQTLREEVRLLTDGTKSDEEE